MIKSDKNDRREKNLFFLLITCFAFLMSTGCDTEDEPVPAYLNIRPFELQATDLARHGSVSEKITNARVFLTDKNTGENHNLGTISLPANIPVIVTGEQTISIDPVIKANGNSLYLTIYPFYNRFTQDITLIPKEELTIHPVTTYKDETEFEFIEDFEGNGHLFTVDRDDDPATFIKVSDEDVFEGDFSGKVFLDTGHIVIVAATDELYELDFASAGKIFMEVNYKTEIPIEFGVLAINSQNEENARFEFVVLEKEEWNKIYFDMTDLLVTSGTNRFVFILRAGLPLENGAFTLNEANFFLDNIKLLHF